MTLRPVRAGLGWLALAACVSVVPACGSEGPAPAVGRDAGGTDIGDTAVPLTDAGWWADVSDGAVPVHCSPLSVSPASVRVATGMGAYLRALGGSGGGALFTLAPGAVTHGASVTVGGGIIAGATAASFDVVASDGVCTLRATAHVEVVGPFVVEPTTLRIAPSRVVRFTATGNLGPVRWDVLEAPAMGTGTLDATTGSFATGTTLGTYRLRAADVGSGAETQVRADVVEGGGFAPAPAVVLVPADRAVRLGWTGGSGVVDAVVEGAAGGAITAQGERVVYSAAGAHAGTVTVTGTDRYTGERAVVKVVVGDEIAPTPVARGPQNLPGDVALADVDHDGRTDLLVGQANRSGTAIENGALLVYRGQPGGGYSAAPDQVIPGARDFDHYAAYLQTGDVDGDGVTDTVAGSPDQGVGRDGQGTLSFLLGSSTGLVTPPERVLAGDGNGDHFGTSWVVSDFDGDGARDVAAAAPSGTNPFMASACRAAGRVYLYAGLSTGRGLFEPVPRQVIEMLDRLDDTDGPAQCRMNGADVGRSMALIDMDADGHADLVIGAPGAPLTTQPTGFYGSVLVYRGIDHGAFEPTPAWVIHLAPSQRPSNAHFGWGLDAVTVGRTSVLVVRSTTFQQDLSGASAAAPLGAFWVFQPGGLGPRAAGGATTRVVTTAVASARFVGAAGDGAGRSSALGDVDGDGNPEYLLGGAAGGNNGEIDVFSAAGLLGTGTITPSATVRGTGGEFLGARLAVGPTAHGMAAPFAAWSAYANTSIALAGGALHLVPMGDPGPFPMRWTAGTLLEEQVFPAADHTGASVALGAVHGAPGDLVVGTTGAHSPAVPAVGSTAALPAGAVQRVGGWDVFPAGVSASARRFWVNRGSAALGAAVAVLDFDGDGRMDLAVGDPGAASGGTDAITSGQVANPLTDPCLVRTGTAVMTTSAGGRGMVRIYLQQADGSLAERFWLWPRESVPTGGTLRRGGFGSSLAGGFDANGDGIPDLLAGHSGGGTSNGAEVVYGRAPDPSGRVLVVCSDPATAPWWPSRADGVYVGQTVAALGDLDGDRCDETAVSIAGGGRAGVSVRYGFGPRCGAHVRPFELDVVPDDRWLRDNVPGDATSAANDWNDLMGANTGMGAVIAGGDVTGDGVPDLLVRDVTLSWRASMGPAVEVISGRWLDGLCPDRTCPTGLTGPLWSDGDYHVVGVRQIVAPDRMIVPPASVTSQRFGQCIAAADIDGDGVRELLVGAPDDSTAGPFAGALVGWHGGAGQETLAGPPWLVAVGDPAETSQFGAACAAVGVPARDGGGAWVAVGAPLSAHRGAETGAAYRWRIKR